MGQVGMIARLVPLVVVLAPAIGLAEQEVQRVAGSSIYKTYCAVCHGNGAKGDGQLADSLRMKPADLTVLAKKNSGTFPKDQVMRIVDGRKPVKGHGGSDMPIWGDAFKQSREGYDEAAVKERIEAVVNYLDTLQER